MVLVDVTDLLEGVAIGAWLTETQNPARGRLAQGEEELDESGFTGAVGAEQAEDFAGRNLKRDAVNAPEAFHAEYPAWIVLDHLQELNDGLVWLHRNSIVEPEAGIDVAQGYHTTGPLANRSRNWTHDHH